MQRRLVMCVVALGLAFLNSTPAAAIGRPFKIGFGGGASVPVSDTKEAFKTGYHGQFMVQWSAPVLPFGLRGSVGYERFDLKSATPGVDGTGSILSGLANASWGFPVGPVKPYITAGLGAFNMKSTVAGLSSPSETNFGINGGAGVEFNLLGVSAFVEGKLENIFTEDGVNTQSFDTRVFPVTFGVFF